jgi:hypothetical protein
LLGGPVHLRQGLLDLVETGRLLSAGAGNIGDDIRNAFDRFDDLIERRAGPD